MQRVDKVLERVTELPFSPVLGVNTISLLATVLGSFAYASNDDGARLTMRELWEHSIGCAIWGRHLARHIGHRGAEETFIAGLLHDIGKSVFYRFFKNEFLDAVAIAETEGIDLADAERRLFETDHAAAGAVVAAKWNLPPVLIETIKRHHSPLALPDNFDAATRKTIALIHLADLLSDHFQIGRGMEPEVRTVPAELWEFLGLDLGICQDLLGTVLVEVSEFRKICDLFSVSKSAPAKAPSAKTAPPPAANASGKSPAVVEPPPAARQPAAPRSSAQDVGRLMEGVKQLALLAGIEGFCPNIAEQAKGLLETDAACVLLPNGNDLEVAGATGRSNESGLFFFEGIDLTLGANLFTVTATDEAGNRATHRETFTRLAPNQAPVAVNDAAATDQNVAVIIFVLANDTDFDGTLDPAMVAITQGPTSGSVSIDPLTGAISYTPSANFFSTDSFTYTVRDNQGLTSNVTTDEDTPVVIEVVNNDTDVDGTVDRATVAITAQPGHGTLQVIPTTGAVTYTPALNFFGADSFRYTVKDNEGLVSNQATVFVTVNLINDAPVVNDQSFSLTENSGNGTVVGAITATDVDAGTVFTYIVTGGSGQAAFSVNAATGRITVANSSLLDFETTPSFTLDVTVTDNGAPLLSDTAVITINLTNANETPTDISLSNNSVAENQPTGTTVGTFSAADPDAGDAHTFALVDGTGSADNASFQIVGNQLRANASFDFETKNSFTIRVRATDGGSLTFEKVFAISVTNVNEAPVATDDIVTTDEDTAKIIDVLANDTDADGDALVINTITQPTNGHAVLNGNGTITYTPNANFFGVEVFTYTIGDGNGENSTAKVTVNVRSVNDAPVIIAMDGAAVINEGQTVTLRGAFTDPDQLDAFSLKVDWGDGTIEVLQMNDGKIFTLTHRYLDDNPTGTASDTYSVNAKVSDNNGGSARGAITVVVNNLAPVANLTGSSSGVRGQTLHFATSITDVGVLDTHDVRWDFGDGAIVNYQSSTNAGALAPTHVYANTGTYTVKVSVRDDDSGTTTVSKQVTIKAVKIQADPCDSSKAALVVGGTNGDDKIRFVPQGNIGEIKVLINGVSQGVFKPTGRIIAYGLNGNDDIEVAGSISLAALLQGDAGSVRLKDGAGASVLCGGAGDDLLIGGSGRSILIGDRGADRLVGNGEDDILIGGYTSYGCDHEALCEILETWTRRDLSYTQRVNKLGTGPFALNRATVFDDGDCDQLTGAAGTDWFFVGLKDKVTDRHASEFAV